MEYVSFLKSKFSRLLLSIIISLLFHPLSGHSADFNVTNEEELREALSIAESNGEDDVINIGAGLYSTLGETFTFESDEDFSLTIEGEGAALTILDGGDMTRVLEINTVSEAPITITIKGLTIQNGFHEGIPGDTQSNGAGISAISQNVTIVDCEFINNSVLRAGDGGGLCADAQNTINLSGNIFSGNSAAFDGGGAKLRAFELKISGNQFIDNSAEMGAGGGTYVSCSKMYINDNEFYRNLSGRSAGGLYSIFFSNQEGRKLSMINNIFAQNQSFPSDFLQGGAISIYGPEEVNIINNTLTMNSSGTAESSALMLQIPYEQYDDFDNVINIYNNIAIANDIPEGVDVRLSLQVYPVPTAPPNPPTGLPSPVTVNYGTVNYFNNDIGSFEVSDAYTLCGFDLNCVLEINEGSNINEDPLFVDAEAGDFSLKPNSPCIDAGDPNAPDVPDTDIFGNPRVPPPDMGAVEFIVQAAKGGGCSFTHTPLSSSLAVFLAIPVLMLIRRFIKRYRS